MHNYLTVLIFTPMILSAFPARTGPSTKDTVLTVTEARVDANGDFIPDRIGQKVTVGGRANVYSGVLHTSRLSVFMQDDSSGIELYDMETREEIAEGDSVVVTGTLEMYEGVTRITRTAYRVVKVHQPMARAIAVEIPDAPNEKYEGMLLRVHGIVTRSWADDYGAYLTLRRNADETDSLVVFVSFRRKPGVDLSKISAGERITVTGVLGQYVRGGPLNTGYEIYPRYPEDVSLERSPVRPYVIGVAIAGGIAVLALLWVHVLRVQVRRRTKQLSESEQRFRNLLENVKLFAVTLDGRGKVAFVNDYALARSGYERQDVLGRDWYDLFTPSDSPNREELRAKVGTDEFPVHNEGVFVEKGGRRRLIAWNNTVIRDSEGKVVGVAGIGEDITEKRQAQEELATSLKEKEVLLKEVYHRVKNNLQTVSSLLSLQAETVKEPEIRELFLESRSRVHSMAMVHERLYRSASLADVDFRSYVESLANSHLRSHLVGNVMLELDVAEIALGIDSGITCGLLLNELLSNSLKHAFPGGRRGKITIRMAKVEGEYLLSYEDDGVGLPEGFVAEEKNSLGMVLITGLAQQLQGKVKVTSGPGTRYVITFPAS